MPSEKTDIDPWRGDQFAHEALIVDSDSSIAARCVPFIEEGLDADQPVLVIASDRTREILTRELGRRAVERLHAFADASRWWRGPHKTMAAYLASMEPLRQLGIPWRLLAEPVWLASPEGRYWSRFEAVANETLTDYPYFSLCIHDRRRLDDGSLSEAMRTHPVIDTGQGPVRSRDWSDAQSFLGSIEPPLSEPPSYARTGRFSGAAAARVAISGRAREVGFAPARVADIELATSELTANSLEHTQSVEISTWVDSDQFVVVIRDHGPGFDPRFAGYLMPEPGAHRGRGLWIARSLADDMRVTGGPDGTRIQMHWMLPRS